METSREASFCAHAINGDVALIVEDAARDERFSDNPVVTGEPHVRFYAGQPLHAGDGSRVGTLCVMDRIPRTFSDEDRLVLRDLAALVEAEFQRGTLNAIQMELLSERDELQRKASIDGLTRVWNRGAILDILDREIARGKRGMPVSVAMIDVDHFKEINDTYGHPTGDGVLVEVAARIRNTVRDIDSVGRYGGEEFLAVFSNCVPSKAADVAERIRRRVGGTPFRTPAGTRTVTVSIGVAGSPPAEGNAALIGAADAALYRAKQAGRDRIELTDE
jgi:diguanylate cyclase (GGDEF)-like protein